jgi:hypothetical protein
MESLEKSGSEKSFVYHVVRYSPSILRDEWVNIGVLLFDPRSGERRFRLMEAPAEFARLRRMHAHLDEAALRGLRDELESRCEQFLSAPTVSADGTIGAAPTWKQLITKWDDTLANTIQLAQEKGTLGADLDAEMERLYADYVAPLAVPARVGAPGSRASLRGYCGQVLRQAQIWNRFEKSVRAAPFTFPGDPMRIDYSYRHNGTRGFVHTLSVSRAPGDAKLLAYTAERITAKSDLGTEFAAITDVPLLAKNERHQFVADTLRTAGIEPVPLEAFAVWVAKLKPLLRA